MSGVAGHPDVVAALEAGLRAKPDTWARDKLHVSDLRATLPGEGCPRELWLRVHGAQARPETLGESLMFDHGHRIHERLGDLLSSGLSGTGWTVAHVELPVADAGLLPDEIEDGRLDIELRHTDGTVLILDFKTVRGRAFHYLDDVKPAHRLQVQTYIMARDADGGMVLYVDREGQNAARWFPVERDDEAVRRAAADARRIVDAPEPPPVLAPVLERRENKGPDSLSVKAPWTCNYCRFRDVSCAGALPKGLRELGIIAKLTDAGELVPKTNNQEALAVLERLLWDEPQTAPAEA